MDTIDTLWAYCTSNNRVIPKDWNKLYNLLVNRTQKPSGGWEPALPLILAAWHSTLPVEKQFRFREHIEWAESHQQIEEIGLYLRNLSEEEWYHFGEI